MQNVVFDHRSPMRLGIGLYLIPLEFVANPALIGLKDDPLLALVAMVKVGAGLWLVSLAVIADRPIWQRVCAAVFGVVLLFTLSIGTL